jgi:integrase
VSKTVVSIIVRLSQAFRVMDPEADRSLLMKALGRLAFMARPVRDIDSHLLPPDVLLRIGERMMDEADTSKARDLDRAVLYRDGLMIMFFVLCPIRRANMQKIQLGEHLVFDGDGARLKFGAEEMKGRRDFEAPLPTELVHRIRRYRDVYRPMFVMRSREDTTALWLTVWGTVMTADRIYLRMKKNLLKRTGKGFTPHMFRHACASFIADMAPERSHIAAAVLHHRSLRTTRRHYVRGQQHRAVRRYQSAVSELVKKSRRSKKKRGGAG